MFHTDGSKEELIIISWASATGPSYSFFSAAIRRTTSSAAALRKLLLCISTVQVNAILHQHNWALFCHQRTSSTCITLRWIICTAFFHPTAGLAAVECVQNEKCSEHSFKRITMEETIGTPSFHSHHVVWVVTFNQPQPPTRVPGEVKMYSQVSLPDIEPPIDSGGPQ